MKPMIQAHLVERDQFGFWTHPNYPDLADNCSSSEAQETLRRLGLELQNVFMESDAPRLYDSARSDQRYSEWIPTRPEGAGWFVLSIHDTDNGPVCQYVRPLGEHLSPIGLDAAAEQHERLLSEACAKALNQRDVAQARVAELEHIGSLISVFRNATRDDAKNGGREYFEKASSAEQELRQEIERIVGALRANAQRWREQFDCMQLQRNHHRDRANAAQARVAELESATSYIEVRQCVNCRHIGINDAADYAACHDCRWTGPEPDEDKCPGCASENCMAAACPECGGRYELVAEAKISTPAAQAGQMPQAWLDVQAERRRQITAEGWTPEHDDEHSHGQMARASACYALAGSSAPNDGTAALLVSLAWPWDEQWWKPSTARRDLVKACALALAEIERLDRSATEQGSTCCKGGA